MLNLSSPGYDESNIKSLVDLLEQNPDVESMILYRNNIEESTLDTLIPALLELPKLKKLNLGYNCIRDSNIEMLNPLVVKNSLKHLILTMNTGITVKSLTLVNSWRNTGLIVDTYHTPISPERIKNNSDEKLSCEFSM